MEHFLIDHGLRGSQSVQRLEVIPLLESSVAHELLSHVLALYNYSRENTAAQQLGDCNTVFLDIFHREKFP